ncbi:pyridoxal-phosphate dependent enzyme [Phaeodactylibacter sp.]|jgi:threonine dehydratase|uniref:threonine ammonia-lyase n=1 Tax=Phaeodactylibacter sp. TaxID=1940289 RepID=UPI0025F62AB2|nr:pyridoxal-phosphate dependent enzyme [Phaeodactylibacter sp.]MCI4650214.1 pyridoxal-phosphate dependent enzyme [Phaeodactylibacter sp.]MCI5091529.1 pyridoxal-phosphate dependent enzyme [Phaeodactylibacter sp.]
MQPLTAIPTRADIEATHEAIEPLIHRTPVLTCAAIDERAGASLFFKCENFQKVGAFKMRGASNAAVRLSEAERRKGLATHSSGNHAQAVALSAKMLGVPAYIVMPKNAPAAKRAATESYGAQITSCENTLAARESTLQTVVEETGATFIHPYNDYNVIAGQATCAKELLEDVEGLDILIAPVGGGGLMSGTTLSARYFAPGVKVFGAEPEAVDDAYRSLRSGQLESNTTIDTIADGLRTNLGEKTFDILKRELDDLFLVSETEILQAMRLIWERMKIIIEPSCAVPLAAILKHPEVFEGKRVGVILTGGNVDLDRLPF